MATIADSVVIIPSSAGSLAELGLFALDDDVAPKMIVLFDRQYRRVKGSFVMEGPKLALDKRGADIEFVDYANFDRVWALVEKQLQIRRVIKMDRRRSASARR